MKPTARSLLLCLLYCAGLCCWTAAADAAIGSPAGATTGGLLGGSLVVPGSPVEGEQSRAQEQARLTNPEAVNARERSRTAYKRLSATAALRVAGEAFPDAVARPSGGSPQLPRGQSVVKYLSDYVGRLDLGGGKRGLIASAAPIAAKGASGGRVPANLGLVRVGDVFEPAVSAARVRIPKRLGDGVQMTDSGVSLTPLDGSGNVPVGAEGVVDGASVVYANTQTDTDTLVKPAANGFESDAVLRSIDSPQKLSFRVNAPPGGAVSLKRRGAGVVDVLENGAVVASVLPPSAVDAAGTRVPVSMSAAGDVLTVTVDHLAGNYRYPLVVDPTVTDRLLGIEYEGGGLEIDGYGFSHWVGGTEEGYGEGKKTYRVQSGSSKNGEFSLMGYATQGESHIYEFVAETSGTGEHVENELAIVNPSKTREAHSPLYPASYGPIVSELCVESGCQPGSVTTANEGNVAYYEQIGIGETSGFFTSTMWAGAVSIVQEKGPAAPSFNESTPTTKSGATNLLYTHGWLGPSSGGQVELTASDPGIGVNEWAPSSSSSSEWGKKLTGGCIECREGTTTTPLSMTFSWWWFSSEWGGSGYIEHHLPDGEDPVEVKVSDAVGLSAKSAVVKIKIDQTPPHGITLSGLPPNLEIGNGVYHVKGGATDGSGSTPSSGVASLVLKVDGKQVGGPSGSCSPGPCTAAGEWTISGLEFGVGQHEVTVTATDKANNVAVEKFTMFVARPTSPVGAGPGSVDPASGELNLSATDVSIGAPGAALTVRRSYGSLHTVAGAEGPLGPQWVLSLGGSENLTKLPDGDMLLTDGTGLQAVYASKGAGEFTPPKGDETLALSEKKVGETVEFTLKDASGSVTTFTPSGGGGGTMWWPTLREQANGLNTTTTSYQIAGSVTEPTEVLAPAAAGVSCGTKPEELKRGCRALQFLYASKTTASGDGPSEWGDYEGRLKEVTFTAWEPTAGKMVTKAVAQYQYDKEGKLRAEWDPRLATPLKSAYGYDAAGRVSAISTPGQQPWLLSYGAIAGDARMGRLLAATRPAASTALGKGAVPANTTAPALTTTTPVDGVPVSVSNGTWSNSPLAYGYQWEDCHVVESKEACAPILGASNQSYTPTVSDGGYELTARVTATNADGSAAVASNKSSLLAGVGGYERKLEFGEEGGLKNPSGVAVDSKGNVWVADTGNSRIEEFTSGGVLRRSIGKAGSGEGQFKEPKGIAIEAEGNLLVADTGNKRLEALSAEGKYLSQVAMPSAPVGIANTGTLVYATLPEGNDVALVQFLEHSKFAKEVKWTYGTAGTGNGQFNAPTGIALSESGFRLYVTDTGNHRVQVFKVTKLGTKPEYLSQFGANGAEGGQFSTPSGVAVEPESLETLSEHNPFTVGLNNAVLVGDPGDGRWQQFNEAYAFRGQYPWQEAQGVAISHLAGKAAGDVYVANAAKNQITEWIPGGAAYAPPEPPNPGTSAVTTIDYHVPISGSGAPYAMSSGQVGKWGQTDDPVEATAIFPPDEPMGWPAKDYRRASLYYLDAKGRTVNTASPTGAISTTEYNTANDVVRTLSPDNRQAALKEGSKSSEVSKLLDTQNTYNKEGTELEKTLGPQHNVKLASGSQAQARGDTQYSYNEGAPSEGGPYLLATKMTESALVSGKEEDTRTTTTSYSGQENLGWKLRKPTSEITEPSGAKLTHTMLYNAETGEAIEARNPANPKEKSPHATETIYYTTAANSTYPACGEHPEWANLTCQTQPSKQPETSGLPHLPVTTVTYNIWNEPAKTTETVGSTTRTNTAAYDAAGRLETSNTTSSVGTALPTVTDEYNSETGALTTQSTTTEGKTKKLTSVYNTLGQLTSYTDADENASTYSYDIDGRPEKVSDGKGAQTYSYDATTGFTTKLVDSAAGTFTASYDNEGNMLSEGYPNGMNANYTRDATGKPTGLEYVKTTHCTEKCTWFSDAAVPSIHGQWLTQTSSLSTQSYTYDGAGRLSQVQSTPAGKGCVTHIYGYDEDTNRTSLTTREPNSKGECATEGGAVEKHSYDEADRLIDTGASYSTFGNMTSLPAADAGGSELTNSYYVDNQLASQTQNGQTIGYNLDPAGRTRETVATGKKVADVVQHYAGPGSAPSWTVNTSSEWTRNIPGIGGSLSAIQNNGETPVLQLTNLHGDIVATAYLSETATGLAATADTTEFGVPATSAPPKYSWLGAIELPTELPSGVVQMGARSYVPQLGRFLQPDPVPGGSANAYTYTFGDPVNSSDPTGADSLPGWFLEFAAENAHQIAEAAAAREAAARAAAEAAARAAAAAVAGSAGPQYQQPAYITEYAMGGASLSETLGSEGIVAGGGMEDEGGGGGGDMRFITDAAATGGGQNKVNQGGSTNEGGSGPCRSGGPVVNGRCQPGHNPGRPSWCKAAEAALFGGGGVAGALKAARAAGAGVIVGAVLINQCGL